MHDLSHWAVAVHGGCKSIRPQDAESNRAGLQSALAAAVGILQHGGAALDAAQRAVEVLENDPTFNAGYGSVARSDGAVEMDAAIMDGTTLDIGGVCGMRGPGNPVRAARDLLRARETLMVGARPEPKGPPPESAVQALVGGDTVGCVVRDGEGRVAAAVSTGGLSGARPGRVGDSPLPGCGFYADDGVGAVAATGEGESISRVLLSARVVFAMESGYPPQAAAERALAHLARVGGEAGLVVIDADGRIGWAHSGDQFAVGE
jgi:beta-aspartyl-peptidase (threonine type)